MALIVWPRVGVLSCFVASILWSRFARVILSLVRPLNKCVHGNVENFSISTSENFLFSRGLDFGAWICGLA